MRQGGALSSAELQAQLGVSQPTVSRAMAPRIQSGEVLKAGAARKQRYLLPRTVRDVGRSIAVMRINAQGQPASRATSRDDHPALVIQRERKDYYDQLDATQKGSLDVTPWLNWFWGCLLRAVRGPVLATLGRLTPERATNQSVESRAGRL